MKSRIILFFLILFYIIVFHWIYKDFLFKWFEYFGYSYKSPSPLSVVVSYLICLLPIAWIRISLERPSLMIYWFLYLFTYIPSILVFALNGMCTLADSLQFSLVVAFSFFIIGIPYFLKTVMFKAPKISPSVFWIGIISITIVLLSYTLYIFKDNLRFSALDNVYDQRYASDDVMQGNLSGYAIMILAGCFFPLLISYGLTTKKYIYVICGGIGESILFATMGAKAQLLSTFIMIGIYFLIRKDNYRKTFGVRFTVFLLVLCVLLMMGTGAISNSENSGILFLIGGMFFLRTLSMGGLLLFQYFSFFQTHPNTYLSHIRVLRNVLGYPYKLEIGQEIGVFFYGDEKMNANANFWATDGIASFGLSGIIFISIIVALLFYFIDCISKKHSIIFATLFLVFSTLSLLNASLFTTLFSGGLMLIMLILHLMPQTIKHEYKSN